MKDLPNRDRLAIRFERYSRQLWALTGGSDGTIEPRKYLAVISESYWRRESPRLALILVGICLFGSQTQSYFTPIWLRGGLKEVFPLRSPSAIPADVVIRGQAANKSEAMAEAERA